MLNYKIMKKILLLCILFLSFFSLVNAEEEKIVIPEEISWTERFILSEIKELRSSQETLKRELFKEIQDRELETVDKALSYSANTVNFFFVLITVIIMWFWVVGWKTIWDIKKSTKESMDRWTKKIITNFEKQIAELEKEQKVNIYWRQFNVAESDKEKMDVLDKIYGIKPESEYVKVERSNIYLSMGLFEKVIEITESIITSDRMKHQPHALYTRICAYNWLGNIDKVIYEMWYLMQLSPDYKDIILESEYLGDVLKNKKIKEILI